MADLALIAIPVAAVVIEQLEIAQTAQVAAQRDARLLQASREANVPRRSNRARVSKNANATVHQPTAFTRSGRQRNVKSRAPGT